MAGKDYVDTIVVGQDVVDQAIDPLAREEYLSDPPPDDVAQLPAWLARRQVLNDRRFQRLEVRIATADERVSKMGTSMTEIQRSVEGTRQGMIHLHKIFREVSDRCLLALQYNGQIYQQLNAQWEGYNEEQKQLAVEQKGIRKALEEIAHREAREDRWRNAFRTAQIIGLFLLIFVILFKKLVV